MQRVKHFFALCCLCAAPYFAFSQEVWSHLGANLQFVFSRPEGTEGGVDLSAVLGTRVDLPLGTRWLLFSPELYFVRKGQFVSYPSNGNELMTGRLDVRGVGLAAPLGISLLSDNGNGIRLLGGLYGDYNYNPQFFTSDRTAFPLEFGSRSDIIDYGAYSAMHIVLGGSLELKLSYFHGFNAKTYQSIAPDNPVKGNWLGTYRYFTATLGYRLFE
jgi:hypothetical protein